MHPPRLFSCLGQDCGDWVCCRLVWFPCLAEADGENGDEAARQAEAKTIFGRKSSPC